MPEQFGINRLLRNSTTATAIYCPLPPAILMNNLRKILLSDSTFSGNQHRQIGRSYLNGNIYGARQCLGITYNTETLFHLLYLCSVITVFNLRLLYPASVYHYRHFS